MPRRAADDSLRYMRRLEGMWETHKLDLHYPNAGREEEVLEMLRGLGELSEELRAAEARSFSPPEPGP
jgi:hypothetical protein